MVRTKSASRNRPPVVRFICHNPYYLSKVLIGDELYVKEGWDNVREPEKLRKFLDRGWYGKALKIIREAGFVKSKCLVRGEIELFNGQKERVHMIAPTQRRGENFFKRNNSLFALFFTDTKEVLDGNQC